MRASMVIVGVIGAISACAAENDKASSGPAPDLEGQRWTIAAFDGEPVDFPDNDGNPSWVEFGNGTMRGAIACSSWTGAALHGEDWLAGGLMNLQISACDRPFDQREAKISGMLTQHMTMREENGRRILESEAGTLELEPAGACDGCTETDRGVPEGDWVVLALDNEGLYDPANLYSLSLAEGRIDVRPGCNSGGGTYEADAGTLTLGTIELTEQACSGYDQTMADGFAKLAAEPLQYAMIGDKMMLANSQAMTILGSAGQAYR